ncbi:MAG: AraC family transcriptional regulator [Planctomycetota bacterium]
MSDLANPDYGERVNRAIDHIQENLGAPLRLEDVARAAYFSPCHFHRVFRSLVGETLSKFVKRVRLERALYLLSHRDDPSLTDVALACGFSSSSDFSRSFKQRYGVPPRAFDVGEFRKSNRAEFKAALTPPEEREWFTRLPRGENPDNFEVALRDYPARHVAYIRVHKPYASQGVPDAAERLVAWAQERGLADGQWLGYQWEDPEIVPLEKCRYDVAVVLPEAVAPDGEVGSFRFPAMTVAEVGIKGDIELEMRGIDWLFGTWLPDSGYAPADQPAFEAWDGRPFAHGFEHFELRIQLPVVDARVPF